MRDAWWDSELHLPSEWDQLVLLPQPPLHFIIGQWYFMQKLHFTSQTYIWRRMPLYNSKHRQLFHTLKKWGNISGGLKMRAQLIWKASVNRKADYICSVYISRLDPRLSWIWRCKFFSVSVLEISGIPKQKRKGSKKEKKALPEQLTLLR